MGLTLQIIAFFVGLGIVYAWFIPTRWRTWALYGVSIVCIYALQPALFIRWLDFLLPTLTLGITVVSWYITRDHKQRVQRDDWLALIVVFGLVIALALFRYVPAEWRIWVASRPPPLSLLLPALFVFALATLFVGRFHHRGLIVFSLILLLFIALKTQPLAVQISAALRSLTGQDVSLAHPIDLNWIGFSYLAFRIIHTIRDRASGLLPALSLKTYLTYVVFFPSFVAGPIDRAERFQQDFNRLSAPIDFQAQFVVGFSRIAVGIFKKFVIADTLARGMALLPAHVNLLESMPATWLLLYGYALRLFFDFSGYSDIAIGIGILFGIKLPENFDRPYLRTSITRFWQSWHITLSDWARFYVFSPLSRNLLGRENRLPTLLIVIIAQLGTMIVIGLWHGVTVNFFIWGIWHGVGLFVHKVWTDNTRKMYRHLKTRLWLQRFADGMAWFLTFQFVVLGWVWFMVPYPQQAVILYARLFGF